MFGSKQQLHKCQTTETDIAAQNKVSRVKCIRYLEAYLDEALNLKEHVYKNKI
jgi:hypothetical protein